MEPQKSADEICEIVAGVMRDFREGMDSSHQLSLRIGRRTTQIIRMGLFSVLALAAAMFYLISILTADFGRITDKMVIMSETMDRMESHFADVTGKLASIERSMNAMTGSVLVLPDINSTLVNINQNTAAMSSDIHVMGGDLGEMQTDVSTISLDLGTMDRNVGGMNAAVQNMTGSVQHMTNRVRTISRPMEMFP
jgi:methyl-accepting chemotaxis protein